MSLSNEPRVFGSKESSDSSLTSSLMVEEDEQQSFSELLNYKQVFISAPQRTAGKNRVSPSNQQQRVTGRLYESIVIHPSVKVLASHNRKSDHSSDSMSDIPSISSDLDDASINIV